MFPEPAIDKCPLCAVELPDNITAAEHLLICHNGIKVGNRESSGHLIFWGYVSYQCICGQRFRLETVFNGLTAKLEIPKRLLRHLELRGGLAAHIFEVTMGTYPKKKHQSYEEQ